MGMKAIQGPSDKHCDCCGRTHRVLVCLDGYWMGRTCAEDYTLYCIDSSLTSLYWRGWEKKHAKVATMVHTTKRILQ